MLASVLEAYLHALGQEVSVGEGVRAIPGVQPEAQIVEAADLRQSVEVVQQVIERPAGPPPDYPRGIGVTRLSKPRWKGTATDKKRAGQLKKDYTAAFDEATVAQSNDLFRELRAGLRAIDEAHNAALWATVRKTFDYPVFVAAPKAAGITSTGEAVPNDLPQILDAYQSFENWVGRRSQARGHAGFSPALRCLIRRWRALETWIVTEAGEEQHSRFPLTLLREVVSQRREAVAVTGSFDDWTPITVHLTGEVSARNRKSPYKGSMFAVYPGDIVFSKIDARNGTIGILPFGIPKAVVTPEFPVLIPHSDRLNGEFAKLILRTGDFLTDLRRKANGTSGRKRITPEAFLALRIPLPSLVKQQSIVATYRESLARAADMEREAEDVETKVREAFEAALGFDPPKPLPDRPAFIASFKDLDRWSHEGILRKLHPDIHPRGKFPSQLLSTVAEVVYGIQKHPGNRPNKNPRPYLHVANVQRGSLFLDDIKMIDVDEVDFERLRLKDGDLLFVEGNGTRENLGRVAVWRNQIEDCIHQNHPIRARLDKS